MKHAASRHSHRQIARQTLALAVTAFAFLAVGASPAFADRDYESQITGFTQPSGLSIDASGDLWATDTGNFGLISEYGPFPSTTKIGEQNGHEHGGFLIESAFLNSANGFLYVGNSGPVVIDLFEGTGPWVTTWNGFAGGYVHVAVDNSGSASNGRVYASISGSFVFAFNPSGTEADFSASAPYIDGNKLTGTPTGPGGSTVPFGFAWRAAVDPSGNLYVVDSVTNTIDEFASSGEFVQQITETPEGTFGAVVGVAVDPKTEDIFAVDNGKKVVDEFQSSGAFLSKITGTSTPAGSFSSLSGGAAVNAGGYLYVADSGNGVVDIFGPGVKLAKVTNQPPENVIRHSATLKATIDPNGGGDVETCKFEYGLTKSYGTTVPCSPDPAASPPGSHFSNPTEVHADLSGLQIETTYHYRVATTSTNGTGHGADQTFETAQAVAGVSTDSAQNLTRTTAELAGSYTGNGEDTSYRFEYGTSPHYGHVTPTVDNGEASGAQHVVSPVANLVANTTYYFRFIAENAEGVAVARNEQSFTTTQSPTIEALSSSGVTQSSADLNAQINPNGFAAECRFEYGPTISYGTTAPCDPQSISGSSGQAVSAHLGDLQGVTYHFRVITESVMGTTTSEDQTFEFFPPSCPNAAVRQQTSAGYLPDCRAYELVSPANASGTLLYPGGPNTGQAISPSRFSYTGLWSQIPGANAIDTGGDLYVATRSDQGWKSNYVGPSGSEAGCAGGPPTDPGSFLALYNPATLTNTVQSDPSMSHFLDWNDGPPIFCSIGANGVGDSTYSLAPASTAPYLWNADGSFIKRLPTSMGEVSGADQAFQCTNSSVQGLEYNCGGDTRASGDLSHIAFSSNRLSFVGNEGLTAAPGSAYDNDVETGTVKLISRLANGEDIAQDSGYSNPLNYPGSEFIRFPAISEDGSHILMSTATQATEPYCSQHIFNGGQCFTYLETPIHLYLSIDDAPAVDVSQGHAVHYVGTTPDLSKVYFSSEAQLLPEDEDESSDLYMWSQKGEAEGDPLTLISKGDNPGNLGEAGNSDDCEASWIAHCGAIAWSNYPFRWAGEDLGGNGLSDSPIAANGDVYFYSPEQLDGDHGVIGKQNLYVYRGGTVQFVATIEPGQKCEKAGYGSHVCSEGPIVRMEATPTDSHMAFITNSRLTSFNNSGHEEMYSYTPSTGDLVCNSCRPDGQAVTGDVYASQDGRFIADDGRTFFSTKEALVRQDTDEGIDVYEYVDGRPQLITTGTGTATAPESEQTGNGKGVNLVSVSQSPGLVGVSANGTDVYFSTYDTLVSEDHNGNFLKFYDARTNGGFAQPTPVSPCSAAEECRGMGSSEPVPPSQGTVAGLSGGNAKVKAEAKKHKKKQRKAAKRRRSRRIHANRGGAR